MSFLDNLSASKNAEKSAARQYNYQRLLQAQAAALNYKYSIKSAQNLPGATRQGYESAGYNPMLAVQNGVSNASSFTSAGTAGSFDSAAAISSGVANAIDFSRLQNETLKAEADTDASYALADKTKAEKAEIIQRLPYVSQQSKANYMKTTMESAKLENDIHYQNEYLKYLKNSLQLQKELGQQGFANVRDVANITAAAQKYGSDVSAAALKYSSDVSANSAPFKFVANKLDKYMKSYFSWWK